MIAGVLAALIAGLTLPGLTLQAETARRTDVANLALGDPARKDRMVTVGRRSPDRYSHR